MFLGYFTTHLGQNTHPTFTTLDTDILLSMYLSVKKLKVYIANTKCLISGYLLLVGVVSVLHDVHVGGEGDVLHHDEHVRHRDPRQQQVDGVGPHVLHNVLSCGVN